MSYHSGSTNNNDIDMAGEVELGLGAVKRGAVLNKVDSRGNFFTEGRKIDTDRSTKTPSMVFGIQSSRAQ